MIFGCCRFWMLGTFDALIVTPMRGSFLPRSYRSIYHGVWNCIYQPRGVFSTVLLKSVAVCFYAVRTGARLRVIVNDLHFAGFSESLHLADQDVKRARSSCSSCPSSAVSILRNNLTSSAYMRQLDWISRGKSLIKSAKSRGDKSEPSGTPDFTGFQSDVLPFTITLWRLSDRYETNHFRAMSCTWKDFLACERWACD